MRNAFQKDAEPYRTRPRNEYVAAPQFVFVFVRRGLEAIGYAPPVDRTLCDVGCAKEFGRALVGRFGGPDVLAATRELT